MDKNPIDCRSFKSLMPDYEWLDVGTRDSLDEHAACCQRCRRLMSLVLSPVADQDPAGSSSSPDFSQAIMDSILSGKKSAELPFDPLLRRVAALPVIAALLLIWPESIVIGLDLVREYLFVLEDIFANFAEETLLLLDFEPGISGQFLHGLDWLLPAVIVLGIAALLLLKTMEGFRHEPYK